MASTAAARSMRTARSIRRRAGAPRACGRCCATPPGRRPWRRNPRCSIRNPWGGGSAIPFARCRSSRGASCCRAATCGTASAGWTSASSSTARMPSSPRVRGVAVSGRSSSPMPSSDTTWAVRAARAVAASRWCSRARSRTSRRSGRLRSRSSPLCCCRRAWRCAPSWRRCVAVLVTRTDKRGRTGGRGGGGFPRPSARCSAASRRRRRGIRWSCRRSPLSAPRRPIPTPPTCTARSGVRALSCATCTTGGCCSSAPTSSTCTGRTCRSCRGRGSTATCAGWRCSTAASRSRAAAGPRSCGRCTTWRRTRSVRRPGCAPWPTGCC